MKIRTSFVTNSSSSSYIIVVDNRFRNLSDKEIGRLIKAVKLNIERVGKGEDEAVEYRWWDIEKFFQGWDSETRQDETYVARELASKFVSYLLGQSCRPFENLEPKVVTYRNENEIVIDTWSDGGGWAYLRYAAPYILANMEEFGIVEVNDNDFEEELDETAVKQPRLCDSCQYRLNRLMTGKCCVDSTRNSWDNDIGTYTPIKSGGKNEDKL